MNETRPTIGVLFPDPTGRRRLAGLLQDAGYNVQAPDPSTVDPATWNGVSLVIAGQGTASRQQEELLRLKECSEAALFPLVVALDRQADGTPWLEAGFDDVLRLPVSEAELTARLRTLLRLREQLGEQSQELAERGARMYRALVEQSLVGIDIVIDGKFAYVNQAWCELLGYAPEEVIGKLGPLDLVHPEDRSFTRGRTEARQDDETVTDRHTLRAVCKDGQIIHLDIFGRQIDYRGQPAILSTLVDVTERVEATEALRESEEVHRLTLSNVSDAIFITDDAGAFTYVCPNASVIFGYSPEEVWALGHIRELLGDDLFDPHELDAAGEIPNIERTITDKDGCEHTLLVTVKRVSVDGGTTLYTCRDITERKAAEEALRKSERRLNALFDNAQDAFFLADDNGRYVDANPAACELLGYSREELLQLQVWDVTPALDQETGIRLWRNFIVAGKQSGEYRLQRKDGETIVAEYRAVANILPGLHLSVMHDITEQKRVDQALRRSEERYRHLLESVTDSVFALDHEWRITLVNDTVTRFAQMPRQRLLGAKLTDLFPGVEETRLFETVQHVMNTREPDTVVDEFTFEDGRAEWWEVRVYPAPDGVLCISTDITEHKRARDALRESEARFQRIARATNDAIWDWDLRTDAVWWSEGLRDLFGHPPNETDYTPPWWSQHIHPQDRDRVMSNVHATIRNGEEVWKEEYRFQRADGTYAHVSDRGFVTRDENGEAVRMAGGMVDVSERKRAEEEIHRLNQFQASIIDDARLWLDVLDEDGNVVVWNRAAEEISGYSNEEVVGHDKVWQWLYPDEAYRNEVQEYVSTVIEAGATVEGFETTIHCKDGQTKIMSWNSRRMLDETGAPMGSVVLGNDVTARKRRVKALEKREHQLRMITDNVPALVSYLDTDGYYRFVNKRYEEWFEVPRTEIIGQHYRQVLGEAAYEKVKARVEAALSGQRVPYEDALSYAHGDTRWVRGDYVPDTDDQGKVRGFFALVTDITERKRMEQALRASEEKFRSTFEDAAIGMAIVDQEGHPIETNTTFQEMVGYSGKELQRMVFTDYTHPDDAAADLDLYQKLMVGERDHYEMEKRFITAQDKVIWAHLSVSVVRDSQDNPRFAVAMVEDITERKQAEEALRENEEKYRTLVENAQLAITIVDQDGGIVFANPAVEEVYGYSVSELTSLSPEEATAFLHPADRDRLQQYLQERLTGRPVPSRYELRVVWKDGTVRWLDRTATRIEYQGQPAVQTMDIDITARKRAEEQIKQRNRELATLLGVSQRLASRLDLDQLLGKIVSSVLNMLPVSEAGSLWLYDEQDDQLVVQAWVGHDDEAMSELAVEPNTSLVGLIYQTGEPHIVDDVAEEPAFEPLGRSPIDAIRSVAGVPLIVENQVIGALFADNYSHRSAFGDSDLRLLQSLASQAGIAIQNARLHEAEQQRASELARSNSLITALSEVATRLQADLDSEQVVHTLETELEKLDVNWMIASLEADERTLNIRYSSIKPRILTKLEKLTGVGLGSYSIPRERFPHATEIFDQGRTLLVVDDDPVDIACGMLPGIPRPLVKQVLQLARVRTGQPALYLPLAVDEGVIGVMWIWGPDLQQTDIPAFSVFAGQVAVAVENARLFEQVRAGRERLQTLSQQIVEMQERERRHIARELHDEVGQALTGLSITLEMNARALPEAARESLAQAQSMVSELTSRVRALSLDLRPSMLDDLGLLPALLWHIDRYTERTQVRVNLEHCGVKGRRFPQEIETATYRIAQEALTNVARYADVDEATVQVWLDEDVVYLQVADQGAGFDPQAALAADDTSGLAGMHERAVLLGGSLTIDAAPGEGTMLTAELPLEGRLERRSHKRSS